MKGGDPMARRDAFSTCHPWVSFLFFALTIFFSMCFMDPASLAASFLCALAYVLRLNGQEALRLQLRALLPILLFTAAVNPLFNHQGDTVLARLPLGQSADPGERPLRPGRRLDALRGDQLVRLLYRRGVLG